TTPTTRTTPTTAGGPGDVLGEDEELMDIGDEGAPLGDKELEDPMVLGDDEIIAATGDSNHMTGAFGGMFAALAGMFLLRKRKED
ncbi:LPXTG cell wall anchor domain-containing protein, partial [Anaerotignum sp.]